MFYLGRKKKIKVHFIKKKACLLNERKLSMTFISFFLQELNIIKLQLSVTSQDGILLTEKSKTLKTVYK